MSSKEKGFIDPRQTKQAAIDAVSNNARSYSVDTPEHKAYTEWESTLNDEDGESYIVGELLVSWMAIHTKGGILPFPRTNAQRRLKVGFPLYLAALRSSGMEKSVPAVARPPRWEDEATPAAETVSSSPTAAPPH